MGEEKMEEIYYQLQQQGLFQDNEYLEKIIELYKKSKRPKMRIDFSEEEKPEKKHTRDSDFYRFLTKEEKNNEYPEKKVNYNDYEHFFVKMTNIWIRNVLSTSSDIISILPKKIKATYKKVIPILQNIGEVKSIGDIVELYDNLEENISEFGVRLNKNNFFWFNLQTTSGITENLNHDFYHIMSSYVSAGHRKDDKAIDYRIYINCSIEDIFKILDAYYDYCEQNKMPFYFKFFPDDKRKDKILVYTSKERLADNIRILKKIAEDYPEILVNKGPNIKTIGVIDDWIGIASEPDNIKLERNYSFNLLRAEILEDAAEKITLDFIMQNINKKVIIDGEEQSFNNIILEKAIEIICSEMKKNDYKNKDCLEEKYNDDFKNELRSRLLEGKPNCLKSAFNKLLEIMPEKNEMWNPEILNKFKRADGYDYFFTTNTIDKITKSLVEVMQKVDPTYLDKFKEEIKRRSLSYGVDPNNFAFNVTALDDFKKLDSEKRKLNLKKNNRSYIRGILSVLPEEIKKVKIPYKDGISIPLEQYVEEILIYELDENNNIVTETGEIIKVSEKIKELINRYSITPYNPYNVSNKVSVDTRNLRPLQNIDKKDFRYNFYYINGIISMLPEEMLEEKVQITDSISIPLKQYVQEIMPIRMDSNQNFIDRSGVAISAVDFIKSFAKVSTDTYNTHATRYSININ